MGAKSSTPSGQQSPRSRTFSSSSTGATEPSSSAIAGHHNAADAAGQGFNLLRNLPGFQMTTTTPTGTHHGQNGSSAADRQRARSLSSVPDIHQPGGGGGLGASGGPPYTHPAVSTAPSSHSFGSAIAAASNNGALQLQQQQRHHHHLAMVLNGGAGVGIGAGAGVGGGATGRGNSHPHVFNIEDLSEITLANTEYNGITLAAAAAAAATSSSASAAANEIGRVYTATSLPSHIWSFNGIKCPVCSKFILPDDIEYHLVMCLTKPRLSYNEDILADAKGECVICLEDLSPGDIIARLPCLCIYHKGCIDRWFEVNRCCPEHPGD